MAIKQDISGNAPNISNGADPHIIAGDANTVTPVGSDGLTPISSGTVASPQVVAGSSGTPLTQGIGAAGSGSLNVAIGSSQSGTGSITVQGAGASGSASVGSPVGIGGVYNSTPPTLTTGQRGDAQLDANANLRVLTQGNSSFDEARNQGSGNGNTASTNFTGTLRTPPIWANTFGARIYCNTTLATAAIMFNDAGNIYNLTGDISVPANAFLDLEVPIRSLLGSYYVLFKNGTNTQTIIDIRVSFRSGAK